MKREEQSIGKFSQKTLFFFSVSVCLLQTYINYAENHIHLVHTNDLKNETALNY